MKIYLTLILQEIIILSICNEIPIEERTHTTRNSSKISDPNTQKAGNSPRRKLTPITSSGSPCKYLASICIFEPEAAGCITATNRHVKLEGTPKVLYVCICNSPSTSAPWEPVTQTELRDCPEIGQVAIYNNQSGYYTIKVVRGLVMNVITYCNFIPKITPGEYEAYTLLYEIHQDYRRGYWGNKSIVDIDDYGLSYSQILFECLPLFKIDFTGPGTKFLYQGYAPHEMALRFDDTWYFGNVCPEIGRGKNEYACDFGPGYTWSGRPSGTSSDTISINKFHSRLSAASYCRDQNFLSPEYCYKNFTLDLSELHSPFPDVRLKGFAGYESLTLQDDDNIWNLDFLIYATYPLALGTYCATLSNNDVQCFPCHHFCIKCLDGSDNIVGEGIAGCQVCNADPNLIFTNNRCECPLPSGFYEHTHGTGAVTCDACDGACPTCIAGTANDCLSCPGITLLCPSVAAAINGSCVSNCNTLCTIDGIGSFQINATFCQRCHSSCMNCSGSTATLCTYCDVTTSRLCPTTFGGTEGPCVLNSCTSCTYTGGIQNSYILGNICQACHTDCLTCNGTLFSDCLSCKFPKNFCELDSTFQTGNCVFSCASCQIFMKNTYLDTSDDICYECDSSCETCDNNSNTDCLTCPVSEFLCPTVSSGISGSCVSGCSSCTIGGKESFNISTILCQECHSNCYKCLGGSDTQCTECESKRLCPNSIGGNEGSCVALDCLSCTYASGARNSYILGNICDPCTANCLECYGPSYTDCLTCKPTFKYCETDNILNTGKCITSCPSECLINSRSTYLDNSDATCYSCHGLCELCYGPLYSNCTQCDMPRAYREFPTDDICKCDEESYYIPATDTCQPCEPLCKWCTSSLCLTCKTTGHIRPITIAGICECVDGYYYDLGTNTCLKCHGYCITCDSGGNSLINPDNCACDLTNTGVFLYNGAVQTCKCQTTNYFETGSGPTTDCIECHHYCLECSGTSNSHPECITCITGNPGVTDDNTNPCICNPLGFYESPKPPIPGEFSCFPCHKYCSECFGPTNNECDQCNFTRSAGIIRSGNSCLCDTLNGWFIDGNGDCLPCHNYCTECIGGLKTECSDCVISTAIEFVPPSNCLCRTSGPFYEYYHSTLGDICDSCHEYCGECTGPAHTECKINKCTNLIPHIAMIALNTCWCDTPYFLNETNNCENCHTLCKSCTGRQSSECIECADTAFEQENSVPIFCVVSCRLDLISHYPATITTPTLKHICKECEDEGCKYCLGSGIRVCEECLSDYYFHNNECHDECPEHTFTYTNDNFCYDCHFSCHNCTGPSEYSCTNCYYNDPTFPDRFIVPELHQCVTSCFPGYFAFTHSLFAPQCLRCIQKCQTCDSYSNCSSCSLGYYLIPEEFKCVLPVNCPAGTAPKDPYRICEKCHFICQTCVGPGEEDCIICNYIGGFVKKSTEYVSGCMKLYCSEQYFEEILESGKHVCTSCHFSCLDCSGKLASNCLKCPKGRILFNNVTGTYCTTCAGIHPGYLGTKEDPEKCSEVCGDSRNMGILECDDGNLVSGDGCDENCKVENGYDCKGGGIENPDLCLDIVPPLAVIASINPKEYEEIMTITVIGNAVECPQILYQITKLKAYQAPFKYIYIDLVYQCSVKVSQNTMLRVILPKEITKDLAGNYIENNVLEYPLPIFEYLSEGEKKASEGAGQATNYSTLLMMGLAVVIIGIQSQTLEAMWGLINFLQLIYYLPLINIYFPPNFYIFITEYLGMANMKFGLPNPVKYLGISATDSLNDRFVQCNMEDIMFLYNFGITLFLWVSLAAFYVIICLLDKILPKKRCLWVRRFKTEYKYNTVWRILLESFLELNVASMLNLFYAATHDIIHIISLILASISLFVSTILMLVSLDLITNKTRRHLLSDNFQQKLGTLIEDYKVDQGILPKSFSFIFLLRRFCYSAILICIIAYPKVQLLLCIFGMFVTMVIWLITIKPFKTTSNLYINLSNEIILVIIFTALYLLEQFDELLFQHATIIGWALIAIVCFAILQCLIIMFPILIKIMKNKFCKKKETEEENEEDNNEEERKRINTNIQKVIEGVFQNISNTNFFYLFNNFILEIYNSNYIYNNIFLFQFSI